MGFFSSIGSAIDGAISGLGSALGSAFSSVCGALGGALSGTAIGGTLGALSTAVSGIAASLGIPAVTVVTAIVAVVCVIAVVCGLKEEGKDEPDEMGMKAEKADKKPEDFDTTEEYIKYLQEEVELTDEDKEKLKNMSQEERAAYQMVGASIYMAGIAEKLGLDPSLPLSPTLLYDAHSLKLSGKEIVEFAKALNEAGLSGNDMSDYLHDRADSLDTAKRTEAVMVDTIRELDPKLNAEEAFAKLDQMLEGV